MRRPFVVLALLALTSGPAAAAPPPRAEAARTQRRPPRALPAIARRVLDDGAVVAALSLPGTAEVVVARATALGALEPEAARVGAFAAFPMRGDASARGLTRDCVVRDGVVLVLDRAPASELAFSLFSLGGASRLGPPSPVELGAARARAAASVPSPGASAAVVAPSDDAVRAAAASLRAAGAAWLVVGDVEIARVERLVERHVPASAPPSRAVASPSAPPPRVTLASTRGTVTWGVPSSALGADGGAALAWFALALRVGASTGWVAGPLASTRTMSLEGASARELERRVVSAHASLLRVGVTPADVAAFRATREAEALSRDALEWATSLALFELHEGDARRAARELAIAWEAGAGAAQRALTGAVAPSRWSVSSAEAPR